MNTYNVYPYFQNEDGRSSEGDYRLNMGNQCGMVLSDQFSKKYVYVGEDPEVWVSNSVLFLGSGCVVFHNWPDNGDEPAIVMYAEGSYPYHSFRDHSVRFVPAPKWMTEEVVRNYSEEEFRHVVKTLLLDVPIV